MLVALVTGAGHYPGNVIACALAEKGYAVALQDADDGHSTREIAARIEASGGVAAVFLIDMQQDAETEKLFEVARDRFAGNVSCLVNSASTLEPETFQSSKRSSWDRHVQMNLRAPFILTQAMAAQRFEPSYDGAGEQCAAGMIVNMIDQRPRNRAPDFSTAVLANKSLRTLTQMSAQALAPVIRVNSIGYGPTWPGRHQYPNGEPEHIEIQEVQSVSKPQDVVAALNFFLNVTSVTGQHLSVDNQQHSPVEFSDILEVD